MAAAGRRQPGRENRANLEGGYAPMILETVYETWAVAAFSLAWFIVGIAAGKTLPQTGAKGATAKRRRGGRKKGAGRPRTSTSTELYVGNLSYDVREKDLRRAFGKYGAVRTVRLIKNRGTGKSKGYGFVEMQNAKEARAAADGLNNQSVKGRRIVVNEAKSENRNGDT